MAFPAPYIRDAVATHTHTIILLHGRGSSGCAFADELSDTCERTLFTQFPGVRWVFPSAHLRWSSVFKKEVTEWFDISSLCDTSFNEHLQVEGVRSSVQYVLGVVEDEIKRVGSADKIVLGGISQGEATALHVLLCGRHNLGAFVGLSGWLPFAGDIEKAHDQKHARKILKEKLGLEEEEKDGELTTPVFLGHGRDDMVIDIKLGEQVRDLLTKLGMQVSWHSYVGAEVNGHWLKEPEEAEDILAFLKKWVIHYQEKRRKGKSLICGFPRLLLGDCSCKGVTRVYLRALELYIFPGMNFIGRCIARSGLQLARYGSLEGRSARCFADLSSLLDVQSTPKTSPPHLQSSSPKTAPPDIQSSPDSPPDISQPEIQLFETDEDLIGYVEATLKEGAWSCDKINELKKLGKQIKGQHVPEILKRLEKSEAMLPFYKWAKIPKEAAIDPTVLPYMFGRLATTDKADDMKYVLKEMHKVGYKLTNVLFITVFEAYGRLNRMDDVVRLFDSMPTLGCNPRNSAYNCVMRILLDGGLLLRVDLLYERMKREGRVADATTYELVIRMLCKTGKPDEAYKCYEEMIEKGFEGTSPVYCSLVDCLSANGKADLALELFTKMKDPADEVYNIVICNLVKSGKLDMACEQYKKMRGAGKKVSRDACKCLLTELIIRKKSSEAYEMFVEVTKAGYIDSTALRVIVRDSYRKCKMEIVGSFVQEICAKGCESLDLDTHFYLVHILIIRKKIDLARQVFRSMIDSGKRLPAVRTYNLFMSTFEKAESARQVFEQLKKSGGVPDTGTYNVLMEAMLKGGNVKDAYGVFEEMMESGSVVGDSATYRLVLDMLSRDPEADAEAVKKALVLLFEKGKCPEAGEYVERLRVGGRLLESERSQDSPQEEKILVKILHKDGKSLDDVYM